MNCWHCNTELIWGGEDTDDTKIMSMVTVIYHVLIVIAAVDVWHPSVNKLIKEYKDYEKTVQKTKRKRNS